MLAEGQGLKIIGFAQEPLKPRESRTKPQNWSDAQGNGITDFKVYWTYANRKTGDKLPVGAWRLRMEHYGPSERSN